MRIDDETRADGRVFYAATVSRAFKNVRDGARGRLVASADLTCSGPPLEIGGVYLIAGKLTAEGVYIDQCSQFPLQPRGHPLGAPLVGVATRNEHLMEGLRSGDFINGNGPVDAAFQQQNGGADWSSTLPIDDSQPPLVGDSQPPLARLYSGGARFSPRRRRLI